MDAKKGYWHVPTDKPSSFVVTFNTPFGRFRFNRLRFGLVVSKDVFQRHLDSALDGLKGVNGIADDILVYGSTEQEHDNNMSNLMNGALGKVIWFNKDKMQL